MSADALSYTAVIVAGLANSLYMSPDLGQHRVVLQKNEIKVYEIKNTYNISFAFFIILNEMILKVITLTCLINGHARLFISEKIAPFPFFRMSLSFYPG